MRDVGFSIAIGAGAAWLLDWPPVVSAVLGAVLVPVVAAGAGGALSGLQAARGAEPPPRGVCDCGHPMSMHCHDDGSGPCATPDCRCPGRDPVASTQ